MKFKEIEARFLEVKAEIKVLRDIQQGIIESIADLKDEIAGLKDEK